MPMAACRLVIADDHPLFRDALRLAVAQIYPDAEIAEADSFDSLRAALEAMAEIDLVLLDLNMPGMQGFSGLAFLRAQFAAVPVAIISANEEPRSVRLALELGAIGYIAKSAKPGEIRSALSALLAGKVWAATSVDVRRRIEDPDAQLAARVARLTPQQVRVLMMLSQGLANKQIAHALEVSEATIKAHVSAVLQKLGADNRTQAVIVARRLAGDDAADPGSLNRPAGRGLS
jgi:DNA-binding NarL/FixJ family response regulator